jgi:hypothetical protein
MMATGDQLTTVLNYDEWNQAVGRHIFNLRNEGKAIRMTVDPLVLQLAAAESERRHHFSSPNAAEDDFVTAVRREINSSTKWCLGATIQDRVPQGLAKLAFQVLAVFRISQDDVGEGYWVALWNLLGRQFVQRGIMPDDLKPETHQDNWASLTEWANDINHGRLGMLPSPEDFDGYRHVKLPLGHGLLRSEDIRQLPRFFDRIRGFVTPGEELDPDELIRFIRADADNPAVFRGAHARRVLGDERLPLAAAQITNALLQWDGKRVDLDTARDPVYRLWLSAHGRDPFHVRGGLKRIAPSGEESDVTDVAFDDLFGHAGLRPVGLPVPYRPIDERMVVTIQSLLDGRYQEARQARPGDKIVLLWWVTGDSPQFTASLQRVAVSERVDRSAHPSGGLPSGWVAFRLRLRDGLTDRDVPPDLRGRIRIDGTRVRLIGGLRVRRAWMKGAGPALEVVGGADDAVIVDGRECRLSCGRLYPDSCPELNQANTHEVWLPGRHRDRLRFRVVDPPMARFCSPVVEAGWRRVADGWPTMTCPVDAAAATVRGPVVEGKWPPMRAGTLSAEGLALPLILLARGVRTARLMMDRPQLLEAGISHPNLLIRQLAKAVPPVG